MTYETIADDVLEVISHERPDCERRRHAENLAELVTNMARFGNRREDPVRMVQSFLGDRWSSLVMHLLSGGMLRFTELRRLIGAVSAEKEISSRMLTLKLRLMERDGLIVRHVTDGTQHRVEYRLTELGEGAYAQFLSMVRWSEQATQSIRSARRAYDALHPDAVSLLSDTFGNL